LNRTSSQIAWAVFVEQAAVETQVRHFQKSKVEYLVANPSAATPNGALVRA
jgi:hypothetical protein